MSGPARLFHNRGDGTFEETTAGDLAATIDTHHHPTWADYDGDGDPDLFLAAGPVGSLATDRLYRNLRVEIGTATFEAITTGVLATDARDAQTLSWADYDDDGDLDCYAIDYTTIGNQLYRNEPTRGDLGFRLVERGKAKRVDDPNAGMGIAAGDYSGDGLDDLFVTNSRWQLHAAHESRAGAPYADARPEFAPALGQEFTGWGTTWADLDLDGSVELAIANGAIPVTSVTGGAERLQLLATAGGDVRPLEAGDVERRNGRGLAAADYDNDGDLDLAVGSIGGRLQLLRNDGARGHWLEVALPRFAPGALVTVVLPDGRKLVREARAGGSYLSSEDPRLHFGVGAATRAREVVVRYPGGSVRRLRDVPVDRLLTFPG